MSEEKVMGRPHDEPPTTWTDHPLHDRIVDAGNGLYYAIVEPGIEVGGKASNLWVWHWHTPTEGAHRWSLSGCGLHDVISVDPLTVNPSLACEDGCPSHGFLQQGTYRSV